MFQNIPELFSYYIIQIHHRTNKNLFGIFERQAVLVLQQNCICLDFELYIYIHIWQKYTSSLNDFCIVIFHQIKIPHRSSITRPTASCLLIGLCGKARSSTAAAAVAAVRSHYHHHQHHHRVLYPSYNGRGNSAGAGGLSAVAESMAAAAFASFSLLVATCESDTARPQRLVKAFAASSSSSASSSCPHTLHWCSSRFLLLEKKNL